MSLTPDSHSDNGKHHKLHKEEASLTQDYESGFDPVREKKLM